MSGASGLIELFFPPACLSCGRVLAVQAFFCERCDLELDRTPEVRCARCAEPGEYEAGLCPRCRARPAAFTRAFAPFAHLGPIARAIHRFKYEDHPDLAPALASLLVSECPGPLLEARHEVTAIPLHRKRFHERRYDQAMLLARELARATGRAFCAEALDRVKETKRQVGLSDDGREQNVAGAFVGGPPVRGKRLLLVDDVYTTGATARAAAAALLDAGAAEVSVLTIARANLLGA